MNTRPTIKLLALLCLLTLGAAQSSLFGQTQPPKLEDGVSPYVNYYAPMLGSDEFATIKKGRVGLLRPLEEGDFGTADRIRYSRTAIGQIKGFLNSPHEIVRINTMRVLGELGTDESVHLLIDVLDNKDPTARHMAVFAIGRAFRTAHDRALPAAMNSDELKQVLKDLAQGMEDEDISLVVDAYVRVFEAASLVAAPNLDEIPALALTELTDAIGKRVQDVNNGNEQDLHLAHAYLRAATLVRDRLADPQFRFEKETTRKVSAIGGHLLAYVLRDVQTNINKEVDQDFRRAQVNICKSTHAVIGLAHDKLDPSNLRRDAEITSKDPAKLLEANNLNGFLQDVIGLIGPPGILTAPPFGYPDEAFIK